MVKVEIDETIFAYKHDPYKIYVGYPSLQSLYAKMFGEVGYGGRTSSALHAIYSRGLVEW